MDTHQSSQISKSLHYINAPLTVPFFGVNIAVWVYMRHYLNLRILFSLLSEFRTVGPYELDWETQQYKCWISNIITFALLAALQALNLFWLFCLSRVAYRYLVHNIAEDVRSEAESEVDETGHEVLKSESLAPNGNGAAIVTGMVNAASSKRKKVAGGRK